MEKLIPTINKLQDVFNTAGTELIQLPQIVVVGEQSSGKSSVLENLVGRTCLPRGINVVTRCPIVLQMIQMDPENELHRQKSDILGVKEWFEFPHLPENEMIETDFEKITEIINAEVNRRAGSSKGIVKEELVLRIMSPNVINLTVVDLPGIVRNAVEGQPSDIEAQIQSLLTTYISNPNSIILAVSAANNDIATSESIKLAKTVDPNSDRTIGVITKLDLMDRGTDATEVLTGKVLKVKLGLIGVVNRSYDDIRNNVTISESIAKEARFLMENYPKIASVNGTTFLKTRLQKLLMEHIKKCLPPLQTRLMNMQTLNQSELEAFGNDATTNKSAVMLEIIEKFCNGYKSTILGNSRGIQKNCLTGGAQINFVFQDKLMESLEDIDPHNDLENSEILTTVANARNLEGTIGVPESAYQDLVRDQIRRLEKPALECADAVNSEMINVMETWKKILEKDMQRYPNLAAAISHEVTDVLRQRHFKAQELLTSFVEVQASFIKTIQADFNENMLELLQANPIATNQLHSVKTTETSSGNAILTAVIGDDLSVAKKTQCLVVRHLVHNYYKIVKSAFLDYCPKAISHAVIYYVGENITRHLIDKLYHTDAVEQLMRVRDIEIIEVQRQQIISTLQALESAIEAIQDIRETYL